TAAGAATAAMLPAGMKVSIRFSLSPPGPRLSRRALGREARMDHRTVAGERRRLDDLVVPFDRQRLRLLVHQDFEEGEEVLGVEARRRGRDAAGHIGIADDLDA